MIQGLHEKLSSWTTNEHLKKWIQEVCDLCQPKDIHLVTGTADENRELLHRLVDSKILTKLNPDLRPNSFLARSNPEDVARVEDRTFICSENKVDAGPTNNWADPKEMRGKMLSLFRGCMQGRCMYIVPYTMSSEGSPFCRIGVEITDSPYVVANMYIMARIGNAALSALQDKPFVKCLHSVGCPLHPGEQDSTWPCNPKETYIVHFPERDEVMSFGSGYGGNALLNKKCFALRLGSYIARREGWLAEHMLIIGVTNPKGEKKYFTGAFPSACGKTNLAMLESKLPGWKVECVGDDIAWMHWGDDGRLYAVNPEAGFFGVAPGTSFSSNPNAMKTIQKNTIFTNVALTKQGDVWWEGMTEKAPDDMISWKGDHYKKDSQEKAAHPNSRFTAPVTQCPVVDRGYSLPQGVPISGIIFGGRRSTTVPLVRQALSWKHGVFLGSSMTSETTAAAKGEVGKLRHDPFAMLPFAGYNMADYFSYWFSQDDGKKQLPEIFYVNWFLKDANGKFLWPGYGDNARVLKWMFERIDANAKAERTPIGYLPHLDSFDFSSLSISNEAKKALFGVDKEGWKGDVQSLETYFSSFGDRLPHEIKAELIMLKRGLG